MAIPISVESTTRSAADRAANAALQHEQGRIAGIGRLFRGRHAIDESVAQFTVP